MISRTVLVLIFSLILNMPEIISSCDSCEKPYIAPGNSKFPYGDENDINSDMAGDDTNKVVCVDRKKLYHEQGFCPFPPEDPDLQKLTNPYVPCPDFSGFGPPSGEIFSAKQIPPPQVQCKTCDVKLSPDSSAVFLQCTECLDIPNPDHEANKTEKNILYKVYFIQIANYTSVNVEGRENF